MIMDALSGELSPKSRRMPVFLAALVAGIGEFLLFSILPLTLWNLLLVHGIFSSAAGAFLLFNPRNNRSLPDPLFSALFLVCFLPLGPPGVLFFFCIAGFRALFMRDRQTFMDWYLALFPEEHRTLAQRLAVMLESGREEVPDRENLSSFLDFITHGTREEKQAVLSLLARRFKPSFAKVLRVAAADQDPTVRVMAATAVANIEDRFQESRNRLLKLAAEEDRPETLLKLARLYDDYAFTGLLDPERELENRTEALHAYRRYLDAVPHDGEAWFAKGRLLMRMEGDLDEAVTALTRALSHLMDTSQVLPWLLEGYFRKKDYQRIRELAQEFGGELLGKCSPTDPICRAVLLWSGEEAA